MPIVGTSQRHLNNNVLYRESSSTAQSLKQSKYPQISPLIFKFFEIIMRISQIILKLSLTLRDIVNVSQATVTLPFFGYLELNCFLLRLS